MNTTQLALTRPFLSFGTKFVAGGLEAMDGEAL
jgi:hypothetical protein